MSRPSRRWSAALLAVLAAFALAVLLTWRDYGITWDEPVQARYGALTLDYYASGGRDTRVHEFLDLRLYGPAFEAAAALVSRGTPDEYERRHLLIALTALLAVLGAARFASTLGDPRLPALAALALVTLPRFYGHAFDDSKDIPFACGVAWVMAAAARLAQDARPRTRDVLACGVALGLTLAVRVVGLGLVPVVALALAEGAWPERRAGGWRRAGAAAAAVLGIAWLVMVLLWPWALEAPLRHPLEALLRGGRLPTPYPTLFEGRLYPSHEVPRRYVPELLVLTTPVAHLALAGLGLLRCARGSAPHRLLALWLLGPLAAAVALRAPGYDGVRHFAFVLPALAVLAAAGAVELAERARRPLLAGLGAALLLLPVPDLVGLHPYQYTFFNALAGGVRGASPRYETEYWLASYREAMLWIGDRAGGRPVRVLAALTEGARPCVDTYRRPGMQTGVTLRAGLPGDLPEPWDYYLATTRYGMFANFPEAPVAHVVSREGAPFAVVRVPLRRSPTGSGPAPAAAP